MHAVFAWGNIIIIIIYCNYTNCVAFLGDKSMRNWDKNDANDDRIKTDSRLEFKYTLLVFSFRTNILIDKKLKKKNN